ncbi:hypothetical protein O6H91_01G177200 [Diphasiastrum complanatum]|uniref:Uncharacterized protein n=1 Tax=Diphasiastrum complanatum TaxID=34168 RepID=A0ACC2EZ60_DIPCM|nr:hypothetical protein O6H91_01G177200 [Diphasiastrum complanatum]
MTHSQVGGICLLLFRASERDTERERERNARAHAEKRKQRREIEQGGEKEGRVVGLGGAMAMAVPGSNVWFLRIRGQQQQQQQQHKGHGQGHRHWHRRCSSSLMAAYSSSTSKWEGGLKPSKKLAFSSAAALFGHNLMSRSLRRKKKCTKKSTSKDAVGKALARHSPNPVSLGEFGDALSMNGVKPGTCIIVNLGPYLRRLPIKRILVWAVVAFILFQLRDFAGVFMGTIVLSMVGNSLVAWAEEYLPGRRRILVAAMYAVIIAALTGIGIMYIPRVLQESAKIIQRIQQNEDPYALLSEKLRNGLGEQVTDQLERFLLALIQPDTVVLESMADNRAQRSTILQQLIKDYAGAMVVKLATLISATSRFALQSLVSLIFSFMLVWDMPSIKKGVQSLKLSRLSTIYEEIAPVITTIGRIFNKALQAQSAIAVVNTVLTCLGMLLLRVSGVGWLSLLVFLCSFVPVAGVIISTVPIGIVAFMESGLLQLSLVVLMVILIHAIEAYVLNPVIYSAHLKLHPLLALGVLVFAEHTLGVWGLIVAVPMAVFFVEYVIKRNSCFEQC